MNTGREMTAVERNILRAMFNEFGGMAIMQVMGEFIKEAGPVVAPVAPVAPAPKSNTTAGSFGLTEREAEMVVMIATTDYNEDDPSKATWSNVVCEKRADAALVSNLNQKGMAISCGRGKEATVQLTVRGLMAYRALRPESSYAKECDERDAEQVVAERSHPNL